MSEDRKRGRPRGEAYRGRGVFFKVSPELYQEMRKAAFDKEISLGEYLRTLIKKNVK